MFNSQDKIRTIAREEVDRHHADTAENWRVDLLRLENLLLEIKSTLHGADGQNGMQSKLARLEERVPHDLPTQLAEINTRVPESLPTMLADIQSEIPDKLPDRLTLLEERQKVLYRTRLTWQRIIAGVTSIIAVATGIGIGLDRLTGG